MDIFIFQYGYWMYWNIMQTYIHLINWMQYNYSDRQR